MTTDSDHLPLTPDNWRVPHDNKQTIAHLRTLPDGSLSAAEVNWLCDEVAHWESHYYMMADFLKEVRVELAAARKQMESFVDDGWSALTWRFLNNESGK